MLKLESICASYDGLRALEGVSLEVGEGEAVAVLGANGAGKSTLLKVVSGLLEAEAGEVTFQGRRLKGMPPHEIARAGILSVPEGRHIFPGLTLEENLLAAASGRSRSGARPDLERVYAWLPWMARPERRRQLGWALSGGEQQMLAIARALMGRPRLLLLDEPSLGLSPAACTAVYELMARIHQEGVALLLVEQNAAYALDFAARAVVLERGRITLEGRSEKLRDDPLVRKAYLAV